MDFPSDPREWLWKDTTRLAGVARPRILHWESCDLPINFRACRDNFALLGQERHFHDGDTVEAMIRLIRDVLKLDPSLMAGQARFLKSLFQCFFSDREDPAWLTVFASRFSFPERMQTIRSRMSHDVQLGERLFSLDRIKRCRILLNDQPVALQGARFFHYSGLANPHLRMQEMIVHRSLERDGLGPPRFTKENWFFLASPEKQEIVELLRSQNPSLELFREPNTRIRTNSTVTLLRFDGSQSYVAGLALSLRPYVGDIIDIRSVRYTTDYLFRSDRNNQSILHELLVPGRYDLF
jgi:hypothetical protein